MTSGAIGREIRATLKVQDRFGHDGAGRVASAKEKDFVWIGHRGLLRRILRWSSSSAAKATFCHADPARRGILFVHSCVWCPNTLGTQSISVSQIPPPRSASE